MEKKLDCIGLACPLPVVEAKKAMEEMQEGILTVLVDNETAVQNLQRLGQKFQYAVASQKLSEKDGAAKEKESTCTVVFSSNKMGEGAEELGHTLIKSFVFALSNVDPLPTAMVFFNSGAYITSEDSPVLFDLKTLEKAGVKIMTCGLCADYYKIKEKVAVGIISNMYEIVETQMQSDKIIKP